MPEHKTCIECGATFYRDGEVSRQSWSARKTCSRVCLRARNNRQRREACASAVRRLALDRPVVDYMQEPPAHLLPMLARRRLVGALDWPRIVIEV